MSSAYYYEKPFEDTTVTSTTTTSDPDTSENNRSRRLIIVGLVVLVILILLGLIALISSRSGSNTPSNLTTGSNTNKVVLQFWGTYLDLADMQPLLDKYNTLNPNVTVQYVNKWSTSTSYTLAEESYRKLLDSLLIGGNTVQIPDIYMVNNTWVGDYDTQYSVASPNIPISTFNSSFFPVATNDFAHDGSVHGVPLWMDTLAVLYNKDMLSAKGITTPPTNWPDFQSVALKLNIKDSTGNLAVAGFGGGTSANTSYSFELINALMLQDGIQVVDPKTGAPTFANDTKTKNDVFTFYQSFLNGTNKSWDASFSNDSKAFLDGKVAMIIAPSYRYRDILKANSSFKKGINIGVSQLPQLNQQSSQGNKLINWADYWGAMVSSQRPNSVVAWDFLNWLTQKDQLDLLNQTYIKNHNTFGILPPRIDMQSEFTNNANLQVYASFLPYIQDWYMIKGADIKKLFNTALNSQSNIDTGTLTTLQTNITNLMTQRGTLYQGASATGN